MLDRLLDLGSPILARGNPAVVPYVERALLLEDAQVGDQTIFPVLVLVAVADEDLRPSDGHRGEPPGSAPSKLGR